MRLFGMVFGGFYALFGIVMDIWDILDSLGAIVIFPHATAEELIYIHVFIFLVGTFVGVAGGYVFVKSR